MALNNNNNVFFGLYYHLVREKKKPVQASFAIKRGWLHSMVWLTCVNSILPTVFSISFLRSNNNPGLESGLNEVHYIKW